ncbi:MAG: hypothetical protein E7439_00900 [Ruminococcaceae bacterium]|nr:hypothetical protein [Oscillospiraceae bacterium]
MDGFLQIAAAVLVAVVLSVVLSKQAKDMSILLTIAVCCLVLMAAASYLQPVLTLIDKLQKLGQLDSQMSQILLKSVGIGLITEIAVLICNDSGNAAMGKALQITATMVVLWLSLPLMESLLELIQRIMGEL